MRKLIENVQQTTNHRDFDLERMVYGDPSEQLVDKVAGAVSAYKMATIREVAASSDQTGTDGLIVSRLVHKASANFNVGTSPYYRLLPRLVRTGVLSVSRLNSMPAESDGVADIVIADFTIEDEFSFKSLKRHMHTDGLAFMNFAAADLRQSETQLKALGFNVVSASQSEYGRMPWQQVVASKQQ